MSGCQQACRPHIGQQLIKLGNNVGRTGCVVYRRRRGNSGAGSRRPGRAGWAFIALRSGRAGRAGRPFGSLRTGRTLRPGWAGRPLGALRTGCTLRPSRAGGAFIALRSGRAGWAGRPFSSLRTGRTLRPGRPGRAGSAGGAGSAGACRPSRAGGAGSTRSAGRPGSAGACRPSRAGGAGSARSAGRPGSAGACRPSRASGTGCSYGTRSSGRTGRACRPCSTGRSGNSYQAVVRAEARDTGWVVHVGYIKPSVVKNEVALGIACVWRELLHGLKPLAGWPCRPGWPCRTGWAGGPRRARDAAARHYRTAGAAKVAALEYIHSTVVGTTASAVFAACAVGTIAACTGVIAPALIKASWHLLTPFTMVSEPRADTPQAVHSMPGVRSLPTCKSAAGFTGGASIPRIQMLCSSW